MALAFGLLVLVILILGTIGVVSMKRVGRLSASLNVQCHLIMPVVACP